MDNYINFSNYSGKDIKTMFREKQKEYFLLIQSEKIAKKILSEYNEPFYTTDYHYRINKEYYSLYECAMKKQAITEEELNNIIIQIPLSSIISRIEGSYAVVSQNNEDKKELYQEIMNEFMTSFNDLSFLYKDGYLYIVLNNEELVLFDDESFKERFNKKGNAYKK